MEHLENSAHHEVLISQVKKRFFIFIMPNKTNCLRQTWQTFSKILLKLLVLNTFIFVYSRLMSHNVVCLFCVFLLNTSNRYQIFLSLLWTKALSSLSWKLIFALLCTSLSKLWVSLFETNYFCSFGPMQLLDLKNFCRWIKTKLSNRA